MLAFPSEHFIRVPRINHRHCQTQTHDNIILSKTHFGSKIWWFKRLYMFQILGLCVSKCIRRSHDDSHKDSNLISSSYELSKSIDIESWGGHISFSKSCWLLNLEFYKFRTHSPISFKNMHCFLGMFLDAHTPLKCRCPIRIINRIRSAYLNFQLWVFVGSYVDAPLVNNTTTHFHPINESSNMKKEKTKVPHHNGKWNDPCQPG